MENRHEWFDWFENERSNYINYTMNGHIDEARLCLARMEGFKNATYMFGTYSQVSGLHERIISMFDTVDRLKAIRNNQKKGER